MQLQTALSQLRTYGIGFRGKGADRVEVLVPWLTRFEISPETRSGDYYAAHALFLSWIYVSGDFTRRDAVFQNFFEQLQGIHPDDLPSFRDDCLSTDFQQLDFVRALRRNIVTRYNDDETYFAVLELFLLMMHHPHTAEGMALWEPPDHPIQWIMKAVQRQLCMWAGSEWEYNIVTTGFECMSYV